ncbi:MAG: DUF6913 domain-containing protein [Flavobacteriaceae bacterium]
MIVQALKWMTGYWHIRNSLSDEADRNYTLNGKYKNVAVLVDIDQFSETDKLYDLCDMLDVPKTRMFILGYKKKEEKLVPFGIQYCTKDDLGWRGKIDNKFFDDFVRREYDLLFNYFENSPLLLSLISLQSKSKIRIGFSSSNNKLNDIEIDSSIKEFETFKSVISKLVQ